MSATALATEPRRDAEQSSDGKQGACRQVGRAEFYKVLDASRRAKPSVKATLKRFAHYANPTHGNSCWPGNARIASDLGISEKTVKRHCEWARANGWMLLVHSGQGGYPFARHASEWQLAVPVIQKRQQKNKDVAYQGDTYQGDKMSPQPIHYCVASPGGSDSAAPSSPEGDEAASVSVFDVSDLNATWAFTKDQGTTWYTLMRHGDTPRGAGWQCRSYEKADGEWRAIGRVIWTDEELAQFLDQYHVEFCQGAMPVGMRWVFRGQVCRHEVIGLAGEIRRIRNLDADKTYERRAQDVADELADDLFEITGWSPPTELDLPVCHD